MAINAYVGLPGSGKSHSALEYVVLPALRSGRTVYTNIPLTEMAHSEFGDLIQQFTMDDVKENRDWFQDVFAKGSTLVLDEAYHLWPAGMTTKNALDQHKSFLAEHRHMVSEAGFSTEICILVQDLSMIASFSRALVNTTYRTTKLDVVGQNNRFRVDVYQGSVTGSNPPARLVTRKLFGKYRKEIYQYYLSQTKSDAQSHGDESVTDKRVNILNSKWLMVGFPILTVCLLAFAGYGFNKLWHFYHRDEQTSKTEVSPLSPAGTGQQSPGQNAPAGSPPPAPHYHHFWDGMKAHIAFNMGKFPWVQYKIAFEAGTSNVTMNAEDLGKLGYAVIGYDQCFLQIRGHGDVLNVFCDEDQPEKDNEVFEQPLVQF